MKPLIYSIIALASLAVSSTAVSAQQSWVGHSALNARTGPGIQYQKVGSFAPCTPVHVVGHSNGWAKLAWNNGYTWVSAKYLRGQACQTQRHRPKPQTGYGHTSGSQHGSGY